MVTGEIGVAWRICSLCKVGKPEYRFPVHKGYPNKSCGSCLHKLDNRNRVELRRRYASKYPERVKARNAVRTAVGNGTLPRIKTRLCLDCGFPAQRYDHFKGYSPEHWLDVQPVCVRCCAKRERTR